MSVTSETDFTLPLIPETAQRNRGPVPVAAFVPIAVAMIGVLFILAGGIKARDDGGAALLSAPQAVNTATVNTATVPATGGIRANS